MPMHRIPRPSWSDTRSYEEWSAAAPHSLNPLDVVANPELCDEFAIVVDIAPLDVAKQPTPLTYQHEKAPAGVMVLGVLLEVLGEILDALAEKGDLHAVASSRKLFISSGGILSTQ